jgi:hypothetical protein
MKPHVQTQLNFKIQIFERNLNFQRSDRVARYIIVRLL